MVCQKKGSDIGKVTTTSQLTEMKDVVDSEKGTDNLCLSLNLLSEARQSTRDNGACNRSEIVENNE